MHKKEEAMHNRALTACYGQVSEGLIHAVSQHRSWKFQARDAHGLELHDEDRHGMSLGKLPLTRVADYLAPLLDCDQLEDEEIHDPKNLGLLRGLVSKWLSAVDSDRRIAGKLKPLHEDKEKCMAIAELLILSKIYPTRAEIFPTNIELTTQEKILQVFMMKSTSSLHCLRKEVMLGRKIELMTAMDMLLELLEIEHDNHSSQWSGKTKSAYMHLIWNLVDIDQDGFFSHDESCELVRLLLSRPSFGRMLTSVCVKKQASRWATLRRATFIGITPSVVLSFVQDLHRFTSHSKSLWWKLDKDGNSRVSKEEFCDLFTEAFWDAIVIPLASMVTQKVEAAGRKSDPVQTTMVTAVPAAPISQTQNIPDVPGSASVKPDGKSAAPISETQNIPDVAGSTTVKRDCTCKGANLFSDCLDSDDTKRHSKRLLHDSTGGKFRTELSSLDAADHRPAIEKESHLVTVLEHPARFEPIIHSEMPAKPPRENFCQKCSVM
eukprot:gnl/MRDRNA2_/MRDRNA2_113617_c0_seq1.p1 gnl/MRDRNA2_/MRDRNA2_113617_c0~~gnl/MRDRNA2_/MRDRNA2_113617_c0_seq1.p1  ORF type:complete len:492 (+),score=82.08 gnl/MRDRNA2_/MRDRNA2_113617_c0_seq1:119-1594(+)